MGKETAANARFQQVAHRIHYRKQFILEVSKLERNDSIPAPATLLNPKDQIPAKCVGECTNVLRYLDPRLWSTWPVSLVIERAAFRHAMSD
ncbi:hypothetical protein WL90_22595 [Burkholderia cenocepacia]|nr:hypothetical protein WL90_22595 [Burkholderia cenocepacia]KWF60373.1 hypothetical protein WL89_15630 [Burkholderia cenocepacia]